VHAAVERVVHDEDVPRGHSSVEAFEQRAHRGGDRAEMERDRDCLRHRLAARVAERSREVHHVADDGRVCRPEDRRGHFVRDRGERVADDLLYDRIRVLDLAARGSEFHRGESEHVIRGASDVPARRYDDRRVVFVDQEGAAQLSV
jgi:hypothetical protein